MLFVPTLVLSVTGVIFALTGGEKGGVGETLAGVFSSIIIVIELVVFGLHFYSKNENGSYVMTPPINIYQF